MTSKRHRYQTGLAWLCAALLLSLLAPAAVVAEALAGSGTSATPPSAIPAITPGLNVVLVLALLATVAWFVWRNRGRGVGNERMRVVASQSLGARERVVVLEIGDQQIVVGLTPTSINTLYVPNRRLVERDSSQTTTLVSFAERLRDSMKRQSR